MDNRGTNYDENPDPRSIQSSTPPGYAQPVVPPKPAPRQPPSDPAYPPQPLSDYPPTQFSQPQPGYQAQPVYPAQPIFPPTLTSNTNTTVVVQQQPQVLVQGPQDWSTGLCDVFADCGVCCMYVCCPAGLTTSMSHNAGECCCVASMCPIALRTKIRTRHNIEGSIMNDWCALFWCGPCAMCQMARELKIRGI